MHFVLLLLLISSSWAHQTSLTSGGNELFWANPNVPLAIRTNTSDLDSTTTRNIILNSMAQWNASSAAKVNAVGSSSNEIKFQTNYPYGSAVIGLTEISYNNSGAIQRAVITLNDDYNFQSTPGFNANRNIFLGDVVTHEIGHLFGLSHSEVLNSTMFYSNFSGQSTVALDDRSGIRQKYDQNFGTITGHVKGGDHIGVLGVHVQAISAKTGESSGAITDENGAFILGGLDLDDTYYLYTAPVKNTASLPGIFSNIQNNFCPSTYVGSFFSKCGGENDGKPQGIYIRSDRKQVDVGTITINCALRSNANYNLQKLQTTFSPVTIYQHDEATVTNETRYEQAFVGWFRNPTDSYSDPDIFKVNLAPIVNPNLYLKVSIVSFPFGTQLQYSVNIKNTARTLVNNYETLRYNSTTETYSTDFESYLQLENGASDRNNFEISVRAKKLGTSYSSQTFPSFTSFSSSSYLPYLVIVGLYENNGGLKEPIVDTEPVLSDNESCLDAPLTYSVANARNVNDDSAVTTNDQSAAAAASCGTIDPPSSGGPGSSLPMMILGFFLAVLVSSITKTRKKFLS